MLRVAVVTHYFPTSSQPWQGHSAYQTLRILSRLCDLRVFCSVVQYPQLLRPRAAANLPDLAWSPPEVEVTYVPYAALPVVSRPLNGYLISRTMQPHLQAYQPDIILNYVIYPHGFAAVRIGRKLRIPVVLTAIGSDLNRPSDPLCGLLTRSALRRADFVTTVSHDLCLTARRLGAYPGSTRAKLNGCDTKVFFPRNRAEARRQLGLQEQAQIIVYVGRLDLRKGLIELVESVSALRATQPQVHCYIIGDGPARVALVDRIAKHNAAGAITLVPSCVTSTVALWMAAANLVTLPSYNEGCPNVVIEALSCGRPVVATKAGGIPELMNNQSGRLVPPRDVAALTQALDQVLSSPWDPEALSSRHSRSWSDVAHELLEIFEELLGQR